MSRVLYNRRVRRRHDRDGDGEYSYSDSYELVDGKWVEKEPTPPGEVSDEPRLPWYIRYRKLILSVAAVIVFLLIGMLLFTQAIDKFSIGGNVESLTALEALYFSVVLSTTLGYGDIVPVDDEGKIAVMAYGVVSLAVIGWVLSLLSDYSQQKVQHLMEKVSFPESSSDPYVVVLSPYNCLKCIKGCERAQHKSSHFEKNLNPVWEDQEVWKIPHSLVAKDVVIQVRDWDDLNYDDLIGEVVIDPQEDVASEWTLYDLPLQNVEDKDANPTIQLEMRFNHDTQLLEVKLVSCKNLPIMDDYTGLLAQSVNNTKELVTALVMLLVLILGGGGLFAGLEEWRYFDGIYFSYVTMTTIGYGDFTVVKDESRGLLIPYALIAVGIGGYIIGLIQAGGVSAGATAEIPKAEDGSLKFDSLKEHDEQYERVWAIKDALSASSEDSVAVSEMSMLSAEEQEEEILAMANGEAPLLPGLVLPTRRRRLLHGSERTIPGRARQYEYVDITQPRAARANKVPTSDIVSYYQGLLGDSHAAADAAFLDGEFSDSLSEQEEGEDTAVEAEARYGQDAAEPEQPPPSGCIPASLKPSTYFGNSFGYRFGKQSFLAVALVLIGTIMAPIEDWTWFDGLYYSIQTLTTTGFGSSEDSDFPTEDGGKIFMIFYSLAGLAAVSGFFALVSEASTAPPSDPELLRLENRLNKYRSAAYRFFHSNAMALIFYVVLLITSIFISAGVWSTTEDSATWFDTIYASVIAGTTLGLGDFPPGSYNGKAWYMFFIIFAIAQLSHVLYLVQKITGDLAEHKLAEIAKEEGIDNPQIDEIEQASLDDGDHDIVNYLKTGEMILDVKKTLPVGDDV